MFLTEALVTLYGMAWHSTSQEKVYKKAFNAPAVTTYSKTNYGRLPLLSLSGSFAGKPS